MRTWLDKHEPVVVEPACADYETFLLEQLASKPSMGYKLLCGSLEKAKGVTIRYGPMRTWLSAHKKSSSPAMAELDLSGLGDYTEYLSQQLLEAPDSTVVAMRDKLIGAHGVSCSQQTMRSWLERARAPIPKRVVKRGSSDLPTLDDPESQGDYLRGLLADDPTMGWRQIREAMKQKGYLVKPKTIRIWMERQSDDSCKRTRAKLAAPMEGLPILTIAGLRKHQAALLREWHRRPGITYTQMKEYLEQELQCTCTKRTMECFMQQPFADMEQVTLQTLQKEEYLFF
jgi:hypothetical protein